MKTVYNYFIVENGAKNNAGITYLPNICEEYVSISEKSFLSLC